MAHCLLCHSQSVEKKEVLAKPAGTYWLCHECSYLFREPSERLPPQEEVARYETHQNVDSLGYRRFLAPVLKVIEQHVLAPQTKKGLDYGCGPTAFLSHLFAEKNMELAKYDPFFYPDRQVLGFKYDYITCTEVFEHMYDPRKELDQIASLLQPLGLLAVMTSPPPAFEIFKSWGYRRDLTHVGFFSQKSFHYIAANWNLEILEAHDNLWVLRKKAL